MTSSWREKAAASLRGIKKSPGMVPPGERLGANVQCRFKNPFAPNSIVAHFDSQALFADFCNKIGPKDGVIGRRLVDR
jgi:hypothetical protein